MINAWRFDPNNYDPEGAFPVVPVGTHRVRIEEAEEKQSRTGKDMIKLTLSVSGQKGKLWYYLVFDPDNKQMTDQNLGSVWESFNLTVGDLNSLNWKGKVGACAVKHKPREDDPSKMQAQVSYFLTRRKQEELPAWTEPDGNAGRDADIPF